MIKDNDIFLNMAFIYYLILGWRWENGGVVKVRMHMRESMETACSCCQKMVAYSRRKYEMVLNFVTLFFTHYGILHGFSFDPLYIIYLFYSHYILFLICVSLYLKSSSFGFTISTINLYSSILKSIGNEKCSRCVL